MGCKVRLGMLRCGQVRLCCFVELLSVFRQRTCRHSKFRLKIELSTNIFLIVAFISEITGGSLASESYRDSVT